MKAWGMIEENYLRLNYGKKRMDVMEAELKRTRAAIHSKAFAMNIGSSQNRNSHASLYAELFGVSLKVVLTVGTEILDGCKSDCARRLLLGCSEKFEIDEPCLHRKAQADLEAAVAARRAA